MATGDEVRLAVMQGPPRCQAPDIEEFCADDPDFCDLEESGDGTRCKGRCFVAVEVDHAD